MTVEMTVEAERALAAALDAACGNSLGRLREWAGRPLSYSPEVVYHVPGDHPLSGTYHGCHEVRALIDTMRDLGREEGFAVTQVLGDQLGDELLVEGQAFNGYGYVRTLLLQLRMCGGTVVEVWRRPCDPKEEDGFWTACVRARREQT